MADYRTTGGAALTGAEREWIADVSAQLAGHRGQDTTIVHIGVEYGGSLHCSRAGAPDATIYGIDLDITKCEEPGAFELIEGDSHLVAGQFYRPVDFLFVDGDHSAGGVHVDIAQWAGMVRGVIAFHDYDQPEFPHCAGVRQSVDNWHWSPTTWQPIDAPDSIRAFGRLPLLRRGEPFGTIGYGVPKFKECNEFWRWWSWLLVSGFSDGDFLLNTALVPMGVTVPYSHNALVQEFLLSDRDTLCIIEDDHSGPIDVIRSMRDKRENWNFDAVCASYVSRREPLTAMGCDFTGKLSEYGEHECIISPPAVARTGTQQHDVAALGLVFIRRWVLEAIRDGGALDETYWFDGRGGNSIDVVFYGKLKELGARVGVDRDNAIVHWGWRPYTMDEFYRRIDAARAARQEVANGSTL